MSKTTPTGIVIARARRRGPSIDEDVFSVVGTGAWSGVEVVEVVESPDRSSLRKTLLTEHPEWEGHLAVVLLNCRIGLTENNPMRQFSD